MKIFLLEDIKRDMEASKTVGMTAGQSQRLCRHLPPGVPRVWKHTTSYGVALNFLLCLWWSQEVRMHQGWRMLSPLQIGTAETSVFVD